MIRFTVFGEAQPAGSKRSFMKPGMRFPIVVDANPKAKIWKEQVAREAARAMKGARLLEGPLVLEATFVRVRPRSHYRSGKHSALLKSDSPSHPTSKPDVLKITRALEDSMTGVVFFDDAQIVEHRCVRKVFGEPARVEVTVMPLAEEQPALKPSAPFAAHLGSS